MIPTTAGAWDVVTLGESMGLFRSDAIGSLAHTGSATIAIGGAESNVAIGLARLGCQVAWIGKIGHDSVGDMVRREIRAEGVDVFDVVDREATTGLMLKERRTPTTQNVIYYRSGSAGSRLQAQDLPAGVIEQSKVLHVTGITPALSAQAADSVHAAVERAKASGVLVSFDVNYRSRLWDAGRARPVMRQLAEQSDLVFAGEDEARLILGWDDSPLALAKGLAQLGPSHVVIKRGAEGCVALIDGQQFTQRGTAIHPIDTVGAGDAFVAGYLAELVRNEDAQQRLRTASRTGAFACLSPGDWEGAARREDLDLLDLTETVTR